MTFTFSDFEDETIGTVPTGWTENNVVDSNDRVEVADDVVLEGSKSFAVEDDKGSWVDAYHSIGDEGVDFAADFNRNQGIVGDWRQIQFHVRDSSDNVMWSYLFADDDSGSTFDVHYDTQFQNRQNDGDYGSKVGEVSVGFHELLLREPQNELELFVDDDLFHSTGQSFSGQNTFWVSSDDMATYTDRAVAYSQFVYHSGNRVVLGGTDQNYVIEGGEDPDLISDRGDSTYAYISGSGVGHE